MATIKVLNYIELHTEQEVFCFVFFAIVGFIVAFFFNCYYRGIGSTLAGQANIFSVNGHVSHKGPWLCVKWAYVFF